LDIEHSDENALQIFERKSIRKIYGPVCEDGVWRVRSKCGKEYDEQITNSKSINSNQEKSNQFTCNFLKVCHQNIRGLFGKTEQLLNSLLFDLPHIMFN
jgi:hypothetical protein